MVPPFFGEGVKEDIHTRIEISQISPLECQSNRTVPLSCLIIPTMTRLPKPLRVGGSTGGPPVSVQQRTSSRSAPWTHFRPTRPLFTEREPYLAALVANSCKDTAKAWAVLGSSKTAGPSIPTRPW